jgi:hypothetical protein
MVQDVLLHTRPQRAGEGVPTPHCCCCRHCLVVTNRWVCREEAALSWLQDTRPIADIVQR